MSRRISHRILSVFLAVPLCASLPLVVGAQDSFGQRGQGQQRPVQTGNPPARVPQDRSHGAAGTLQQQAPPVSSGLYATDGNTSAMQGNSSEAQDFGVAPTQQLRPSNQLGGPTPTSIPGGRVIGTQQLAQLLQGGQANILLLHAYGSMQHLPGAIPVGPAAQGGSFDDQVQREFGQYLQQITNGDQTRALVFYCGGVQCWGSYNAALRAMRIGYRNVAWYRGGIEAWQQAGLPVLTAGGPVPEQGPRGQQQQPSAPAQW
ncbi:MAG: rhodanese-like domain-containing protein [Luteimonas sp.]|nr:rhodanese-like domain-containing protein [Luteimonas sp.]